MESEKLKKINAGEPNRLLHAQNQLRRSRTHGALIRARGAGGEQKGGTKTPSEQGRGCKAPCCCPSLKARSVIHIIDK
jgi:hypothetical protein